MFSNNLFEQFIKAKTIDLKFQTFNNFKELIDTESKPLSQEYIIKKYLEISEDDWIENVKLRNVEREEKAQMDAAENAAGGGDGGGSLGGGLGSSISDSGMGDIGGDADAATGDTAPPDGDTGSPDKGGTP
jgi:hypothetical protein